jgi:hypothetical protein
VAGERPEYAELPLPSKAKAGVTGPRRDAPKAAAATVDCSTSRRLETAAAGVSECFKREKAVVLSVRNSAPNETTSRVILMAGVREANPDVVNAREYSQLLQLLITFLLLLVCLLCTEVVSLFEYTVQVVHCPNM